MPTDCISYQNSGYFSKLIVDYLNQSSEVQPFYNHFPTLDNFKFQIEEKSKNFPFGNRKVIVRSLEKQYEGFEISETTRANIQCLDDKNSFTITTGH